jgi:ATP-dependent DNA helicase RecG
MKMAIKAMNDSVAEPRDDGKVSPKVGAVLIKSDGTVETACRGELRYGDHAEFTLLERKNRANLLEDGTLFATLEPCAPGARKNPKLGCAERIVNARIKKVWIGIEDPDPNVDRKGIKFLEERGIEVEMFHPEFQKQIREANKEFLKQALQRKTESEEKKKISLSHIEEVVLAGDENSFSRDAIEKYLKKTGNDLEPFSDNFWKYFETLGMVERVENGGQPILKPTGFGILLFGKEPRNQFPQFGIKAKVKYGNDNSIPQEFAQPLVLIPDEVENWLKKVLHSNVSRQGFERQTKTDFPIEPLREAIINALVHRDYEIAGAKVSVEIDDDKIVIKSPGLPVEPISFDDVKAFKAPSLSRNPKITYIYNQMRLMEETALGMETFRSMLDKYNLPTPEYSYQAPFLVLTFGRSIAAIRNTEGHENLAGLNNEELVGFEWIKTFEHVSKKEYAEKFNFNEKKAQRHLTKMKKLGLLNSFGQSTAVRYSAKI